MTFRTKREEFDIAKKGLLKQMSKSQVIKKGMTPSCRYRGDHGMCCAVGFLVSDEVGAELDDRNTLPWEDTFFGIATNLNPVHEGFYMDLQSIHDNNQPENWALKLDQLEAEYEL